MKNNYVHFKPGQTAITNSVVVLYVSQIYNFRNVLTDFEHLCLYQKMCKTTIYARTAILTPRSTKKDK